MKPCRQILSTAAAAAVIWGTPAAAMAQEDCGPAPTGVSSLFGDARERWEACYARRRAQTERATESYFAGQEKLVEDAQEACKQVARRLSRDPSTLSFDRRAYDRMGGLNSASVNITEGGYSAVVSGSDIGGRFRLTCFMTKAFQITSYR